MNKLVKTKNLMKIMGVVNCLAMALVAQTANTACAWILGQPKEPEEAKRMRRF